MRIGFGYLPSKLPKRGNARPSGMALPMVLWAIALLAGIVILLAGIIEGWLSEETLAGKAFRARQQALSGIAVAMNPSVKPGDPVLEQKSGEEGYKVVIHDESGLINPNPWLAADRRDLFKRLFTAWGLDINQTDAAADGLYDWQSASPFRSLHGAKQPEYDAVGRSGLPPGAPFLSREEMELVIGFDPVRKAKPDWQSLFTTYYTGKINILHAPKTLLTDLLGLTPLQADAWIALRNGKDGIEGTDDDFSGKPPADAKSASAVMGAKGIQQALILDLCDTSGSMRRIESSGFCNGVRHSITVIVTGNSTQNSQAEPSMLGWSEQ